MEEVPNPPGLKLQRDFITPEHEAALLSIFQHELSWPEARTSGARLSLHYGYTFDYKTFGIDPAIPFKPFPAWLQPLMPAEMRPPDQVCLQHYPPGAGIPPHADTHSAYDQLYGLSLGAAVTMLFRRRRRRRRSGGGGEEEKEEEEEEETDLVDVDLPPRSMMQMTGDSRLHWEHGIKKRKKDILPDGTVRMRADRWSITYRWLRESGECECGDERLCDTAQRRNGVEREYRWKQQGTQEEKKNDEELVQGGNQACADASERVVDVSAELDIQHRQENGNTISSTP